MGLLEYLAFCKGALEKLLDFPAVHVVQCNEACDLDSAVSAIVYAYYLHETSAAPVGTALFLPLLNIRRSEFPLRTEITYFFGKYGITSDVLVFLDDLDLMEVKLATDLKVTLVDHHVLSPSTTDLEESVIQVIDHRPQDGSLPDRVDCTLELVGSCCTLVTEALLADEGFAMDEVSAALLHGTIVTDTINFSPAAGKTTPKDLDMAEKLGVFLPLEVDNDTVFQEIKEAKFDLSGLTTEEILQKDLKVVPGDSLMVAMSSVTMEMTDFAAREDFIGSLRQFSADRNVDAVVVLTVSVGDDGSMSRQLGIFSPSRVYREQMADVLNASQSPSLGLSPLSSNHEEFLAFEQSNVKASRKQILPVIKGFLSGETTPDENQSNAYVDLPKERSEGFTSMSSIVGSQPSISDGEITSEEMISRDDSTEKDISLDDVLPSSDRKVFDPLSSVHSSDSVSSPSDFASDDRNAFGDGASNKRVIVGASMDGEFWRESVKNVPKGMEGSFETGMSFVVGADVEDDDEDGRGGGDVEVQGAGGIEPFSPPGDMTGDVASALNAESWKGFSELNPFQDSAFSTQQPGDLTGNNSSSTTNPFLDSAFSVQQPVSAHGHNNHHPNTDPSQHNGLDDDLFDLDPLSLAAPHEVLFPLDSPADFSAATSGQTSGQTSGHGSKAPSYPVTPPNSYMESGLAAKETHLPSFNSSEMVEKIQEKKAALEGGGFEDEAHADAMSPFTPQNSYVESNFEANYAKQTHLPSFHSSDMVERIRVKRSSMERDIGSGNDFGGGFLDVSKSPFTPHNSFVDGSFDKYARENLPSLNSTEIANRIKQRQVELTVAAPEVDIDVTAPDDDSPGNVMGDNDSWSPTLHAYTPQNSYRESPLAALGADSRIPDMNEVAERLSLTGSESSGSLNEPRSIKASNKVHFQGMSPQDEEKETRPARGVKFAEDDASVDQDGEDEREEVERQKSSTRGVKFAEAVVEEDVAQNSEGSGEDESAAIESAIQKIAYDLANEMIQKALETFPSESVKELVPGAEGGLRSHPSISDDSSPTMDLSDREFSPEMSPTLESFRSGSGERDLGRESLEREFWSDSQERAFGLGSRESEVADDTMQASQASPSEAKQKSTPSERSRKTGFVKSSPWGSSTEDTKPEEDSHKGETFQQGDGERAAGSQSPGDRKKKEVEAYPIETEYLRDMDQRVNRYNSESSVIETDADREVVESSSFRKISGQENQTVQEEILEQIQQEAWERTQMKMKQSSFAEDEESGNGKAGDDESDEDLPSKSPVDDEEAISDKSDENSPPTSPVSFNLQDGDSKHEGIGGIRRNERASGAKEVSNERTRYEDMSPGDDYGASGEGDDFESSDFNEERESAKLDEESVSFDPLDAMTSSPMSPLAHAAPGAVHSTGGGMDKRSEHTTSSPTSERFGQEFSDLKRRVVPEADISLDDSLTGEDGKKMIHVVRDRELYASALNNVNTIEDFESENPPLVEAEVLQPPQGEGVQTSLLDTSDLEEQNLRKKVEVGSLDTTSLLEEDQRYDSLTEEERTFESVAEEEHKYESLADVAMGNVEAEGEAVSVKGDPLGAVLKNAPERMLSTASDVSVPGSQKGDRLKGVELTDEWQDDELPKILGGEDQELSERSTALGATSDESKKRLVPESGLVPQDDALNDVPVVESDSEFDSEMDNDQLEWENDTPVQMRNEREAAAIPEYTAVEEHRESLLWKVVRFGSTEFQLDMKVIEPYKRVLSHGGYYGDSLNAMIVFSGCYLPSKDRKDYSYVMDHLFNYVIHTLDELVADDYMIVYFHGATPRRQMPNFSWLKRCYQCIDRKLKKNLKALYLVHPTLWLKTVVVMTRPFISTKFSSKLQFVRTLDDLKKLIPMEYVYIPEQVQSYDNRHFHPSLPPTPSSNQ